MIGLFLLPVNNLSVFQTGSDSFELFERDRLTAAYLPVGLKFTIRERMLSKEQNGDFRIEVSMRTDGVNWAGEPLMSSKEVNKESFLVSASGQVVEATLAKYDEGWGTRSFHLQEAPLVSDRKVGDTWTIDFKKNESTKAVAAHGEYRYTRDTDLAGIDAMEIEIQVKELSGVAPATSAGTVWLRKSDHLPIGFRLKITNACLPGIPGLGDGTFERMPIKK